MGLVRTPLAGVFSMFRTRPTVSRPEIFNLFSLYCTEPVALQYVITMRDTLNGEHSSEISRWNRAAAVWGLKAQVQRHPGDGLEMVEIGDLDGTASWIAYRVDDGWQLDEFDGTSERHGSLALVLQAVADV